MSKKEVHRIPYHKLCVCLQSSGSVPNDLSVMLSNLLNDCLFSVLCPPRQRRLQAYQMMPAVYQSSLGEGQKMWVPGQTDFRGEKNVGYVSLGV